jgi:pimeloyl-ACP methyl ester carboxylesterase
MKKGVVSSLALLTLVLSVGTWGCREVFAADQAVITCSEFASTLRHGSYPFRSLMQSFSATFTGASSQSIRYLAVKPSAGLTTYPTVVFFNGTSQITPDWPAEMLVSPGAALCNHAALVFFDYPGVGGTTYPGEAAFTFDKVAETVYDLLASLKSSGALTIGQVDPAGWSLGTAAALKFGTLAAHNESFRKSGMSIGAFFLIGVKAGGDIHSSTTVSPLSCGKGAQDAMQSQAPLPEAGTGITYYPAIGNQAMCATSVLDQLLVKADYEAALQIKNEFAKLTFPYVESGSQQAPYGTGDPATVCAATISGLEVEALCNIAADKPVETACDASASSLCATTLALFDANREERPYIDNISYDDYYGERAMIFHFDYATCSSASTTAWQSTGCQFNPHQTGNQLYEPQLVVDGSPCITVQTVSENAAPVVQSCPGISRAPFAGVKFYVWNGQQDLLIRNDYGKALCNWLADNNFPCTYHSFANAGHAVLFTYASTLYQEMATALASSDGAARQ